MLQLPKRKFDDVVVSNPSIRNSQGKNIEF